jgi:transglutaminase-like putative cysteine protease
MYYLIRHYTRYEYTHSITENVMELRLQPRADGQQRLLSFELEIDPAVRLFSYRDPLGNHVHHFDLPEPHDDLLILSESLVETLDFREVPDALPHEAWGGLEEIVETENHWDMLLPSRYTEPGPELDALIAEIGLDPDTMDPLTLVRHASHGIHSRFQYTPQSTRVDSPIAECLSTRRGVCQDFSHVLIAVMRRLRIPARYVSGYLFHRELGDVFLADDAMHAWVEVLLPSLGWLGVDPTADTICGKRHIRTAIGRDYADVPPTKGVYRGGARSLLGVSVKVFPWGVGWAPPPLQKPPSRLRPPDDERPGQAAQQQQQ